MMHIRRRVVAWGATLALVTPLFAVSPALAACCACQDSSTNKSMCLTILKGGCATVRRDYSSNPDLSTVTCTEEVPNAKCKTPPDGVCSFVADATLYSTKPTANSSIDALTPPALQVDIPGLTFTTDPKADGGDLQVSFLAQYISAAYKYLVGVSIIAAAIMIVYGGVRYIIGSSATSISTGKEVISDAIVGLFLVLGTYTILGTLNTSIINPKALSVRLVDRLDAGSPEVEMRRVTEAATVKPPAFEAAPVISETASATGSIETVTVVTPPAPPSPAPGTVIRDPEQRPIPQGSCPEDMIAIPHSDSYQPVDKSLLNPASFCMDIFEAPNQRGVKPFLIAHTWEAEWYCNDSGKRLCKASEFVRACLGPQGTNTYGYGPDYIEGANKDLGKKRGDGLNVGIIVPTRKPPAPCNYDSVPQTATFGYEHVIQPFNSKYPTRGQKELSVLNPNNPRLIDPNFKEPGRYPGRKDGQFPQAFAAFKAEIAKYEKSEPSGSRPLCVTAEGVYDLPANVAEMTIKDKFANLTTEARVAIGTAEKASPYSWRGFAFSPIPHLANVKAKPNCTFSSGGDHGAGDGWRDWVNGFRCCTDLQL